MHWASWANMAVGVWLFVSPWFFQGTSLVANRNNMLFGFLLAVMALPSALMPSWVHSIAWTNMAFGVWLVIAPVILGYAANSPVIWSGVLSGLAVVVFSLIRATARPAVARG